MKIIQLLASSSELSGKNYVNKFALSAYAKYLESLAAIVWKVGDDGEGMRVEAGRVATRIASQSAATFLLYAESALCRGRLGRACPAVSAYWRGVVGRRRPGCSALSVSHADRRPDFNQKPGHICRVTWRVAACTTHDFFSVHNGSHVKNSR